MRFIALLLLAQADRPIPRHVWMNDNPKGKMLRPMLVVTTQALVDKIVGKTATLDEVQSLVAKSGSEDARRGFYQSPEVTVIVTAWPNTPGFGQLLVSKKDGVTSYWFLRERNHRDGCMEVYAHFSDGPDSGRDLSCADEAAGPATGGVLMLTWAKARMCP